MKIYPFSTALCGEAAALFIQSFKKPRLITPLLPSKLEDHQYVEQRLNTTFQPERALVAIENGKVLGYLSWFEVDHFRDSERKGAYVPEWGHAAVEGREAKVYQALYRAAGERWAQAGCQVHAITLLAHDRAAEKAWFWNGFGLTVIDAIRPMQSLGNANKNRLTVRKASLEDAEALAELDAEHWQHYAGSPIFMPPHAGMEAAGNLTFLSRSKNSAWLADDQGKLAGFLRFEGYDFDSVAMVESEDGILITGAYVRPAYRGKKVAVALLEAALQDYQRRGLKYCAVTFESFNPEAANFWPRYFEPVGISMTRMPEHLPGVKKTAPKRINGRKV